MQSSVYQGEKFRLFIAKVKNLYNNYGFDHKPTNEDIAEKLGVKPMQLNRYYKSANLQRETVLRILKAFEVTEEEIWGDDVSLLKMKDWSDRYTKLRLIESLQESPEFKNNPVLSEIAHRILNEDSYSESKDEITPVAFDDYMMVEYVDLSASAGMLGGSNVDLLPETKKRLVPKEFEKGNYLVVRVNGDSMVDGTDISIPDGAEILVKEYVLENGDKLPIRGNLFVICSREGNVFKQVVEHNTDLGYIRCRSYNNKYADYNIPLDDVFQIFIYRKIVGYRPSIPEI